MYGECLGNEWGVNEILFVIQDRINIFGGQNKVGNCGVVRIGEVDLAGGCDRLGC